MSDEIVAKLKGFRTLGEKTAYMESFAAGLDWKTADSLMRSIRMRLASDPRWRLGGHRVRTIFMEYALHAEAQLGRMPRRFLDFGAGVFQPLGYSALFWLHGAERCVALDNNSLLVSRNADYIAARTAKSLWDILCEVLAEPELYGLKDGRFVERVFRLNRAALRDGDLDKGLGDAPIRRFCGLIQDLDEGDFDFTVSQAVLEHVHGFDDAARALFERTAPGGVHFHDVDFRDHRSFNNPAAFSKWDFLFTEEGDGGACNRLRLSEVVAAFERAGFRVLEARPRRATMPDEMRARIIPRFRGMSEDDLTAISAELFLQRP